MREPIKGYLIKKDDVKLAYVVLPKEMEFKFPEIFDQEAKEKEKREDEKALEISEDNFKKYLNKNKNRQGVPSWYTI